MLGGQPFEFCSKFRPSLAHYYTFGNVRKLVYQSLRVCSDNKLGRSSGIRRPQQADAPNDFLEEDFTNLALVLNKLELGRGGLSLIEQNLSRFYDMYERVHVRIDANTANLLIREKGLKNPISAH